MLLKSKEEISRVAFDAAIFAMKNHASVGWNMSSASVMGQLTELVALAVQAGIKEALNGMYSNSEFEQDIGLNK